MSYNREEYRCPQRVEPKQLPYDLEKLTCEDVALVVDWIYPLELETFYNYDKDRLYTFFEALQLYNRGRLYPDYHSWNSDEENEDASY